MTSVRLAVAFFLALVLAPSGLLLGLHYQALAQRQYAFQDERRRRAVTALEQAEDAVFQEIRAVIAREDERGVFEYQYAFVPEDVLGAGLNVRRSPLAAWPTPEHARGYFQLDAEGVLSTPHINGVADFRALDEDPDSLDARLEFLADVARHAAPQLIAITDLVPRASVEPGPSIATAGGRPSGSSAASESSLAGLLPPEPEAGAASPWDPEANPKVQRASGGDFRNTADVVENWSYGKGKAPPDQQSAPGKSRRDDKQVLTTPENIAQQREAPFNWQRYQDQGRESGVGDQGAEVGDRESGSGFQAQAAPPPAGAEQLAQKMVSRLLGLGNNARAQTQDGPNAASAASAAVLTVGPFNLLSQPDFGPHADPSLGFRAFAWRLVQRDGAPYLVQGFELSESWLRKTLRQSLAPFENERLQLRYRSHRSSGTAFPAIEKNAPSRDAKPDQDEEEVLRDIFDAAPNGWGRRSGEAARDGSLRETPPSRDAKPDQDEAGVLRDIEKVELSLDPGLPYLSLVATERDPKAFARELDRERFRLLLLAAAVGVMILGSGAFLWRMVRQRLELARRQADFVSAVTHELKTPLTSIRMRAEMLREGWITDPGKVGRYHETIVSESERLSRLITNVLDFSKLENRTKKLHMTPLDLGVLTRDCLDTLRPTLESQGASLECSITGEGSLGIDGDRDALAQVVVNLVDNAVKYSAEGRAAQVKVAVTQERGSVTLEVADQGIGIAPREHQRIFENFYRVGNELTRRTQGAGIGLALVREYARAHGAHVEVHSALGQGSRFTLRFPAARGAG